MKSLDRDRVHHAARERERRRSLGKTTNITNNVNVELDRVHHAASERESLSGAGVTNNTTNITNNVTINVANGTAEEDWEAQSHFMGDINGEVSDDEYEEHDENAADY